MKKTMILILITFVWVTSIAAQITRSQADIIALNYISNKEVYSYCLYVNAHTLAEENFVVTTSQGEVIKVKYACWIYYFNEYIDENKPQ